MINLYEDAFLSKNKSAHNPRMTKQPKKRVADILTEVMRDHGFTASFVSETTKVPQPTITRIMNGESRDPRFETLEPLARFFHMSVPQLRGEEPIVNVHIENSEGHEVAMPPEAIKLLSVWCRVPFSQRPHLLKYMESMIKTEKNQIADDPTYEAAELDGDQGFTPDMFTLASPNYFNWEEEQKERNSNRAKKQPAEKKRKRKPS